MEASLVRPQRPPDQDIQQAATTGCWPEVDTQAAEQRSVRLAAVCLFNKAMGQKEKPNGDHR